MNRKTAFLLPLILTSTFAMPFAFGATYNFYFNNTEQGEHSTANPSLTVNGKTQAPTPNTSTSPATAAGNTATGTLADLPAPKTLESAAQTTAQISPAAQQEPRFAHLRMGLSYSKFHDQRWATVNQNKDGFYEWGNDNLTLLSLGYSFNRSFGIGLMGGTHLGGYGDISFYGDNPKRQFLFTAELEYIPLRMSLFGKSDLIHLALLAGADMVTQAETGRMSTDPAFGFHFGARTGIDLSDHFQLTASIRSSFGKFSMNIIDAGFVVLL